MQEGWLHEDYLILFDESETAAFNIRYDITAHITGFQIIGLKGWDDFILRNKEGQQFTIPTVPLDLRYLALTKLSVDGEKLVPDERVKGKIKWYTKPVVFGGSPTSPDNMCWITLDQHIDLVKWWNQTYRTISGTG